MKSLLFIVAISIYPAFAFAQTSCEVVLPGDYPGERVQLLHEAGYTVILIPEAETNWISLKSFTTQYVKDGQYTLSSTSTIGNIVSLNWSGNAGFNLFRKVNGSLNIAFAHWNTDMTSNEIIKQYLPVCSSLQAK